MAKNIIKMTSEDKKYFRKLGHPESDFNQLEDAFSDVELTITDNNIVKGCKTRKCGAKRAIEVLGREMFLNGLSRAAFHATSARYSSDERFVIEFDLKKWWR